MAKKQYKDEEGSMSKNELETIERSAKIVKGKIKNPDQQLPAWVQSKITKASDQISAVANYMQGTAVDEGVDMSSLNINRKQHKEAQKQQKIVGMTSSPNPNEAAVAREKLRPTAAVSLPKLKEENTLVNQILSEMGNCNKSEKGKHCPSHGKTECPGVKKNLTVEQITKKHRLEVGFIEKQLQVGIKVEREHTNDTQLAMKIALQHLDEIPDYYDRLKKMEGGAKKEHKQFKDVKESTEDKKFCKLCNKMETRPECSYGGKAWDKYTTLDPNEIAKHSARMNKKDKNIKEHCGCEGDAVKELEDGLKKSKDNSYDSIDKLMRRIMKKQDMTAKQLHNAFKDKHHKTPDEWIAELNESAASGDQGLRDWFGKSKSSDGKSGWVQLGGDYAGKPCARQEGQTSTPKCGSSKMAANLSPEEEEAARLRKNRQDPNQPEKTGGAKPTNVRTEEIDLQEVKDKPNKGSGKKDACYSKVKSRYDVWPSAYASGALVKCRKVGAANWGTKSEEVDLSQQSAIKKKGIKPNSEIEEDCWDGYQQKGMKKKGNKMVPNCVPEKNHQKESIEEAVRLPSKSGNILAIILSWKGKVYSVKMFFPQSKMPTRKDVVYEIQKIYPGCILRQYKVSTVGNGEPLIQVTNSKSKDYLMNIHTIGEEVELEEDWQSINRKDKTDGLSQKAVKAYRREHPGSKLKTAVTEKKPTGKRKQRRSNFCSRMSGMKSKLTSAKTARDPDSNINKALRRWNCR
jgi:hypothetical protein